MNRRGTKLRFQANTAARPPPPLTPDHTQDLAQILPRLCNFRPPLQDTPIMFFFFAVNALKCFSCYRKDGIPVKENVIRNCREGNFERSPYVDDLQ
jgi:hypothetical protein